MGSNTLCKTFKPRQVLANRPFSGKTDATMTVCANCGCLPHDSAPAMVAIDDETREALCAGIQALTEQNAEVSRMISESDYTDTSALSALHCERLQHIAALSRLAGK